jgi:hypothetical protein
MVEGNGQFRHPETGRKMASMQTHFINNILTQFFRQLLQLVTIQFFKIGR